MANFERHSTSRGRSYTRPVSPTATAGHTACRQRSSSLLRRYARPKAWKQHQQSEALRPPTPPASPGHHAPGSNPPATRIPAPAVQTPSPTHSCHPVFSSPGGQKITITTTSTTTIVMTPTSTTRRSGAASVPSTPSRSQAKASSAAFRTPQKQAKASPTAFRTPQWHTSLDEVRFPDPSTFSGLRGTASKKYYVISKGRRVGIFVTWTQMTPWIKEVARPIYESFVSFDRAYDCYADAFRDGYLEVIEGKGQDMVVISQPPPLPVPPLPMFEISDSEDDLSSVSDLSASTAVPSSPTMHSLSHKVGCLFVAK